VFAQVTAKMSRILFETQCSYYGALIRSHIWSVWRCYFQWSWM